MNPRIGPVDIKMWAEVRIPWVTVFLFSLSAVAKQYSTYSTISPNVAFMVLATWLYINACGKGEELIPQTWDMAHEKFGWLLSFWNLAGVPFSYCYSIIYMATHDPKEYRFPTWAYVLLYSTLLVAYYLSVFLFLQNCDCFSSKRITQLRYINVTKVKTQDDGSREL